MAFWTILLGCSTLFLTALYWFRRSKLNFFKKLGIDGPEPNVIFGNLAEARKQPLFQCYREWTKKYGKVFGYYEGPVPIMVISDLDLLQQVFVKQFSKFHSRKQFPLHPDADDETAHMFVAQATRWKRLRSIINPTFSTSKLKQMSPLVNRSISDMMEQLEVKRQEKSSFDIYRNFERLTLDVIGDCAFGMTVDSQRNPNAPFLLRCRQIFMEGVKLPFLLLISILVPELSKFWMAISKMQSFFRENPMKWLLESLGEIIEIRRNEEYRRVDLLQLMLDAEEVPPTLYKRLSSLTMTRESKSSSLSSESSDGSDKEVKESQHSIVVNGLCSEKLKEGCRNGFYTNGFYNNNDVFDDKPMKKALTTTEIKAQCTLFLLAGYETSSNALAYATYELALNQDVQAKLVDEIHEFCPKESDLCCDILQSLQYLDMVVCETLRKYPLASPVISRLCSETSTINGILIPEGTVIQANVWAIHYDPEHWGPVDTEKFYPERFDRNSKAKRHPLAWMAFGAGPRNCVGMRFALMEVKFAIIRMLQSYVIRRSELTQVPLQFREGGTICPRDGIQVTLEPRTD